MRELETFLHGHLPAMGEQTGVILVLADREGLVARSARAQQAMAAASRVGRASRGDPRRSRSTATGPRSCCRPDESSRRVPRGFRGLS